MARTTARPARRLTLPFNATSRGLWATCAMVVRVFAADIGQLIDEGNPIGKPRGFTGDGIQARGDFTQIHRQRRLAATAGAIEAGRHT